uniref:Uncharacterized protein n=1 Tax=Timema bartmani TaxID=61472 RepID=A0A7R9I3Q7_9NEOP|nr:unnamed protein product [Timema bartmani]
MEILLTVIAATYSVTPPITFCTLYPFITMFVIGEPFITHKTLSIFIIFTVFIIRFYKTLGGHLRLLMMTRKPCSVYRNVSVVLAYPSFLAYLSEKLTELSLARPLSCAVMLKSQAAEGSRYDVLRVEMMTDVRQNPQQINNM